MAFTDLFSQPWRESSQPSAPSERHYLPVSIGNRSYMIEVGEYQRVTVDAQRQQIDQQAEATEALLSSVGAWRRSQEDWSGGAGQVDLDHGEDVDRGMFFESNGIDVLSGPQMQLLPGTIEHYNYPGTYGNGEIRSLYAGGYFWVAEDELLSRSPAVPGEVSLKALVPLGMGAPYTPSETVTSMTSDGIFLYVSRGTEGIWYNTVDFPSQDQLSATDSDEVAVANGRLISIHDNNIAEVSAAGVVGGAGQLDYDEPRSGFTWLNPVTNSAGIIVGGGFGSRWALYLIGVDDAGALTTPRMIAELPYGEELTALYSYTSFVVIGTTRGVRIGQLEGNALIYGTVIETEKPVKCFTAFGEFIYFGQSSDTDAGIGRIDLTRATKQGRFAWQNDIRCGEPGTVQSIHVDAPSGYVNFTVNDVGMFLSSDDRVPSGELISSWITFGTSELKVARHFDLRHLALDGEVQVQYEALTGNGEILPVGASETQGSYGSVGPWRVRADKFHRARYRLTLTPKEDDATKGPKVTLVSFSALPTPPRVDRFIVPILLFSKVRNHQGDGAELSYDTLAEFQYLKDLEASKTLVAYREGKITEQVYVDSIEMKPEKWNDDTSFFEGICYVQLYSTTA